MLLEEAELEKKIPNVTDFVKKLTELENKIPDISNLEKTALTAVENKNLALVI